MEQHLLSNIAARCAASAAGGMLALLLSTTARAAEPVIRSGDIVAVCGDSITEQKIYSVYIEDYLLMCQPTPGIGVLQCGWGGATATHFSGHMANDVVTLAPTVATICYGMNDGGYTAADPATEQRYREALTRIVDAFKNGHTRSVILGSPGVVDSRYFKNAHHPEVSAEVYNTTLGRLGGIAKEVAEAQGMPFADLHTPMMAAMLKAKAELGDAFPLAGWVDGVHAGPSGHLAMAYGFLKAMGVNGDIGTIIVDIANGTATASDGQRIISSNAHTVVVESRRYPFCFFAGSKDTDKEYVPIGMNDWPYGNAAILPFLPFNAELNRYRLVVHHLTSARASITWGKQTKTFSAEQLTAGINLAAEFLDNPFVLPFMQVNKAVEAKQAFETTYIKDFLADKKPTLLRALPAKTAAVAAIEAGFRDLQSGLAEQCVQAVKPVTHTIVIEERP